MDISSQLLIDENNAKNLALSANIPQDLLLDGTTTTVTTVETTVVTSSSGGGDGQLIDFGGSGDSLPHINNANMLNNNSNTTTTGASQLVTGKDGWDEWRAIMINPSIFFPFRFTIILR